MKHIFIAAIHLLLCTTAFSQNTQHSPDFKVGEGFTFQELAATDNSEVVMLSKGNDHIFEVINKEMNAVKEFKYTSNSYCRGKALVNNSAVLVTFYYDAKSKGYKCDVATASTTDFKFAVKTLLAFPSPEVESGKVMVNFSYMNVKDNAVTVTFTEDKSAFALYVDFAGVKDKEGRKELYIYDTATLKLLFEKKYTGADARKFAHGYESLVLNEGRTAAYLTSFLMERVKSAERVEKFYYQLERVDAQGYNSLPLKTEAFRSLAAVTAYVKNDKVYCVGAYGEDKKNDKGKNGIFFYDADAATLAVKNVKYNPFSAQFNTDKFGNAKGKKIYGHFELRDCGFASNGDIFYSIQDHTMEYSAPATSKTDGYTSKERFKDIIIARLSTDGNLLYSRNFNGDSPYFDGAITGGNTPAILNGEMGVVLNTVREAGDTSKKLKAGDAAYLNFLYLTATGEVKVKSLIEGKKDNVLYNPKVAKSQENTIFMFGMQDKMGSIIRINQ